MAFIPVGPEFQQNHRPFLALSAAPATARCTASHAHAIDRRCRHIIRAGQFVQFGHVDVLLPKSPWRSHCFRSQNDGSFHTMARLRVYESALPGRHYRPYSRCTSSWCPCIFRQRLCPRPGVFWPPTIPCPPKKLCSLSKICTIPLFPFEIPVAFSIKFGHHGIGVGAQQGMGVVAVGGDPFIPSSKAVKAPAAQAFAQYTGGKSPDFYWPVQLPCFFLQTSSSEDARTTACKFPWKIYCWCL